MEKIFFIFFIVFCLFALINPLFFGDKVNNYVKQRQGKLIDTNSNFLKYRRYNSINKSVNIKYYDKNQNKRTVTLYYIGFFSYFGEDEIVEYDTASEEYLALKEKEKSLQLDKDKKARSFEEKKYTIYNDQELLIKQEYTNPNIGEYVFIESKAAPDGKYKLGFMNYIHVKSGKIESIKSS